MFEDFRGSSTAHARTPARALALALALLGACGCAMHPGFERLANGDLHVACRGPLANCLLPVADACAEYGFDVVAATERHARTGAPTEQADMLHSEATVRCRRAVPLFGKDPNAPVAPRIASVAPPASARVAAPPRCVPGASQACATTSGCSGAQVCVTDGTHFGPCECASAPISSAGAPMDAGTTTTDAGATPTDSGATTRDAGATPTDSGATTTDAGAR
jgi:hypothetical protein